MKKFKNFLDNFEGYCCVLTLATMSIVVFVQVVCRYVIKSSLPWSEEVSRYLLVWTTFLGGAYGIRTGAHLGIEAFTLLLPKKAQKILSIFVMLGGIVLCAIIFKFGADIVSAQLAKGQLSPALRVPMGYMYAAIPIGMAFFILRYIQGIYFAIKDFNKDEIKEVVS